MTPTISTHSRYVVVLGDSLPSIAAKFRVLPQNILNVNRHKRWAWTRAGLQFTSLQPGEAIWLPTSLRAAPARAPFRALRGAGLAGLHPALRGMVAGLGRVGVGDLICPDGCFRSTAFDSTFGECVDASGNVCAAAGPAPIVTGAGPAVIAATNVVACNGDPNFQQDPNNPTGPCIPVGGVATPPCPAGYALNASNGNCELVCPSGQVDDGLGRCGPPAPTTGGCKGLNQAPLPGGGCVGQDGLPCDPTDSTKKWNGSNVCVGASPPIAITPVVTTHVTPQPDGSKHTTTTVYQPPTHSTPGTTTTTTAMEPAKGTPTWVWIVGAAAAAAAVAIFASHPKFEGHRASLAGGARRAGRVAAVKTRRAVGRARRTVTRKARAGYRAARAA